MTKITERDESVRRHRRTAFETEKKPATVALQPHLRIRPNRSLPPSQARFRARTSIGLLLGRGLPFGWQSWDSRIRWCRSR